MAALALPGRPVVRAVEDLSGDVVAFRAGRRLPRHRRLELPGFRQAAGEWAGGLGLDRSPSSTSLAAAQAHGVLDPGGLQRTRDGPALVAQGIEPKCFDGPYLLGS
jgi:hypothetical protein